MQHVGNYAPLLKACSKIQFVNCQSINWFTFFQRKSGKSGNLYFWNRPGPKISWKMVPQNWSFFSNSSYCTPHRVVSADFGGCLPTIQFQVRTVSFKECRLRNSSYILSRRISCSFLRLCICAFLNKKTHLGIYRPKKVKKQHENLPTICEYIKYIKVGMNVFPPKINTHPQKGTIPKEICHLPTIDFQGIC